MSKLDEILSDKQIPKNIIKMIMNLDDNGKKALDSYYDETSEFFQNAHPMLLARRFLADPYKYSELYHYTESKALEAIFSSKTFLIGSIMHMNDDKEMRHSFELCIELLKEMNATKAEIDEFKLQWIFTMIHFDAYIWSFTVNDSSMAMERYGNLNIEFNNQTLQEKLANRFTPLNFANGWMKEGEAFVFPLVVNYDRDYQLNYLRPIIRGVLSCIQNMKIDSYDMRKIIDESLRSLYILSLCFKRPEIFEEREIRFVILRIIENGKTQEDTIFNGKPMIKLPINENDISAIIINHDWDGKEEKIFDILHKSGFSNVEIRKTRLPY